MEQLGTPITKAALPKGWRFPHNGTGFQFRKSINGALREWGFEGPRTLERLHEAVAEMELKLAQPDWQNGGIEPISAEDLPAAYSRMFIQARKRSKQAGRDYTLTEAHEKALVHDAHGKCALTAIPFSVTDSDFRTQPFAPSLDRIDASRGYAPGNCRIVTWAANNAMADWGEAVFAQLARAFVAKELMTKQATGGRDGGINGG